MLMDGFSVAKQVRLDIKKQVDVLRTLGKRIPMLSVVIVGEDLASKTYVASKAKQCEEVGFLSQVIALDATISQADLEAEIKALNNNDLVDGILVQLPLPNHLDENRIIEIIDPKKDVDGLHPLNVGLLELGQAAFVPCTPKGIITLLKAYNIALEGKRVLVIGRSRLVGKPVASLLLKENATVTMAHSKTQDLKARVLESDIVVVAIGKKEFISLDMLKKEHIIVDVGIHRYEGKLYGDVAKEAYEYVAMATPVPKGVGPMTIASLLENTLYAYNLKEQ
jgi:methylenetetrahydrofolate dehydrogenase (NADP+) / methenyltetrahydrofolate cyclohydrolase